MQKIVPHLWFDKEAVEAATFYVSVFAGDSNVKNVTKLHDTPSGDVDVVSFTVLGHEFSAISAGPLFQLNPSISFSVLHNSKEEINRLWSLLIKDGAALMEIGSYPWSERYGWLKDTYGVSWQLMYAKDTKVTQPIVPSLMFVGTVCGKAEEALLFYTSIFKNAKVGNIFRYSADQAPDKEGTIAHSVFTLEGQEFMALDSAHNHTFAFNEALSLMVRCDTQKEIDYFWKKLSAVPKAEQCGWLKDTYGVSWQIVPSVLGELLASKDQEKVVRTTKAFLAMKKLDIAELEKAAAGT